MQEILDDVIPKAACTGLSQGGAKIQNSTAALSSMILSGIELPQQNGDKIYPPRPERVKSKKHLLVLRSRSQGDHNYGLEPGTKHMYFFLLNRRNRILILK